MADPSEVKAYLACWFQLGKSVVVDAQQGRSTVKPSRVLGLNRWDPEFESCWQNLSQQADQTYLEGTEETLADLLSHQWEITHCARCDLLVPVPTQGPTTLGPCPCADLSNWPNELTLPPRLETDPAFETATLTRVQSRLSKD